MSERIYEQVGFGEGIFVGPLLNDPTFSDDLDIRDQARYVGFANGCPVAKELTDPNNTTPGRGPENMLHRYGEVNYWFGHIIRTAEALNPDLATQLMMPVPRFDEEPAGKFEGVSVPESHFTEIAPMGTLPGYALPRIFVRQLGGSELPTEESQTRLDRGLAILEQATTQAESPAELLAIVAGGIARADVAPLDVLHDALSLGWLGEHNAHSMLAANKAALRSKAPQLWQLYQSLSNEQKTQLGIA